MTGGRVAGSRAGRPNPGVSIEVAAQVAATLADLAAAPEAVEAVRDLVAPTRPLGRM
jgi:hypothetical protein